MEWLEESTPARLGVETTKAARATEGVGGGGGCGEEVVG